jgi:hypothetical protein
MKKLLLLTILSIGCSTASIETSPRSIYINSPDDLSTCKFLGVVETKDTKNWQEDLREAASQMGATHIQSSGPNNVGFNEIVSGYAYQCK